MAASATILVIAPDPGMRRSLAFALEAEGYPVKALADFDAAAGSLADDDACAVVDEDALKDRKNGSLDLKSLKQPVVLLVDRLQYVPAVPKLQVIEKPVLGGGLLKAVLSALAMGKDSETV